MTTQVIPPPGWHSHLKHCLTRKRWRWYREKDGEREVLRVRPPLVCEKPQPHVMSRSLYERMWSGNARTHSCTLLSSEIIRWTKYRRLMQVQLHATVNLPTFSHPYSVYVTHARVHQNSQSSFLLSGKLKSFLLEFAFPTSLLCHIRNKVQNS